MTAHPDMESSSKERQARAYELQELWKVCTSNQYVPHVTSRPLLEGEIRVLSTTCRCRCTDWGKIRLVTKHADRDHTGVLLKHCSDTALQGSVVLVWTESVEDEVDAPHDALPRGVHSNAVISDCLVHLSARVHRNACLTQSFVGPQAVVVHNGTVTCRKPLTALTISVGPESGGGRELCVLPEDDLPSIVQQMTSCSTKERSFDLCSHNVLDGVIRDNTTIDSVYVPLGASLEGANRVEKAILLPGSSISGHATACNVQLQWNAGISDHSSVSDTLLMEESHAGPHSIVASTVLGPDVHVSAGEIHASVLGPNTNAHHQSLLIGVLWPLGRGNVGYGANVGSNHTGRLPDQEAYAGEGLFWGLSAVIKFPVNVAPYSIVAAGTTVPPQRISMPFSLIVSGDGCNDIIPGWLLRSSPYTLSRSEKKYATRRKAKRHDTGWKIIRAETVAQCWQARQVLQSICTETAVFTTEKECPGIGLCRLSAKGRSSGIEAYTDCIQRYALEGLLRQYLEKKDVSTDFPCSDAPELCQEGVAWTLFPWEVPDGTEWHYQRYLLTTEFDCTEASVDWLKQQLEKLVELEVKYAAAVRKSKSRDDSRGQSIVPGYADSHVAANDDPVVAEADAHVAKVKEDVASVLQQLSS